MRCQLPGASRRSTSRPMPQAKMTSPMAVSDASGNCASPISPTVSVIVCVSASHTSLSAPMNTSVRFWPAGLMVADATAGQPTDVGNFAQAPASSPRMVELLTCWPDNSSACFATKQRSWKGAQPARKTDS